MSGPRLNRRRAGRSLLLGVAALVILGCECGLPSSVDAGFGLQGGGGLARGRGHTLFVDGEGACAIVGASTWCWGDAFGGAPHPWASLRGAESIDGLCRNICYAIGRRMICGVVRPHAELLGLTGALTLDNAEPGGRFDVGCLNPSVCGVLGDSGYWCARLGQGAGGRAVVHGRDRRWLLADSLGWNGETLLLSEDGRAYWARDAEPEPVQIVIPAGIIRLVSWFDDGACALDSDGAVWCGRPGDVEMERRSSSVSSWVYMSGRCGLSDDGGVWCWGMTTVGLAEGGAAATQVPLPARATDVAEFVGTACARLVSDEIWCWGSGEDGRLGNGVAAEWSSQPLRVVPARPSPHDSQSEPQLDPFPVADTVMYEGLATGTPTPVYSASLSSWCDDPPIEWGATSTGLTTPRDARAAFEVIQSALWEALAGPGHGVLSLTIVFGDEGGALAVRVQALPDRPPSLPPDALSRMAEVGCRVALSPRPGGRYVVEQRLQY